MISIWNIYLPNTIDVIDVEIKKYSEQFQAHTMNLKKNNLIDETSYSMLMQYEPSVLWAIQQIINTIYSNELEYKNINNIIDYLKPQDFFDQTQQTKLLEIIKIKWFLGMVKE